MKHYSSALLILLMSTATAFASVSISSPSNGDHVSSPFTLSANSTDCASQPVKTIGYSIDNSSDTTMVSNTSLDTKISTTAGTHTIHVKSWGDKGAVCVTDAAVTVSSVTDDVVADTSIVPSGATSVGGIQSMSGWNGKHDSGTNGSSSGSTKMVGSPSHSGPAREFAAKFKGASGERYSVSFGDNRTSTNFLYDAWIYVTSSISHVANIEMDVNQTMPNGQTVIYGVQCSANSGKWEYTQNLGTAKHAKGHWTPSKFACNPRNWSKDKWHHVQISYSRTSTGRVTYHDVYFDGAKSAINETVFAARALGWGSTLSTNFQLDGSSSGSTDVYLGGLTIYRW